MKLVWTWRTELREGRGGEGITPGVVYEGEARNVYVLHARVEPTLGSNAADLPWFGTLQAGTFAPFARTQASVLGQTPEAVKAALERMAEHFEPVPEDIENGETQ